MTDTKIMPDLAPTLTELFRLMSENQDALIARCEGILADHPQFTPALMMLALAAFLAGDEGLSINFLETAHQMEPDCKEYVDLLAAILPRVGRVSDSLYYGKLSVALSPNPVLSQFVPLELSSYHAALSDVGISRHSARAEMALRSGYYQSALKQGSEELRINPASLDAMMVSARALLGLGQPQSALNILRALVHLKPDMDWLHVYLAEALIACADHVAAVPHLRLALELQPKNIAVATAVAGLTEWLDDASWQDTQAIRNDVEKQIKAGRGTRTDGNVPPPSSMLGFVSDQCHAGSLTSFIVPVLKEMDDTVLYRINQRHDVETQLFHHAAMRVRELAEADIFTFGRTMVGDVLNSVVYLGAPSHESKYVHFAGSGGPAAVQWLSDPLVDRLPTAELVVSDPETRDVDEKVFGSDRLIALNQLVACTFTENPAEDEIVGALPRSSLSKPTFGVWGDLRRFTVQTIALWSRCLWTVPNSTLLIGCLGQLEGSTLEWLLDRFGEYGVASRIRIHKKAKDLESPLAFLADVDVLLDSAPVSIGPEVARVLWMGVPVVCMKGRRRAGRFGTSILRTAGCSNWIAESEAEFCIKAAELALAPDLEEIRAGLRDKVLSSNLVHTADFARSLTEGIFSKVAAGVPGR